MNELISVEFIDNYVYIDRIEKQTKINISEIEKIIETKQHFFIKFTLEVIIIPKTEIDNQDFLKKELLNLTKKLNIELENQLNWKW
ncbi:YcxB family protein [Flavobacterium sp. LMO9]|uniref:YcxB family protein n=1 Tax=unclassified Flavobacterium TaxID=196869 RepID=UPI00351A391E